MIYIAIYLAAISLLAIILTIHDKRAARQRKWRVRESTLAAHQHGQPSPQPGVL
jgi:uncharacterized membrane protein YsdA (DUF1294 family)